MFHSWRYKLREAEEAAKLGRLEEARQLLSDRELQNCLPGQKLTAKLAHQMAQRACRRVVGGETAAAWRDLKTAQKLGGETDEFLSARDTVFDHLLGEIETRLQADDPSGAIGRLERLRRENISGRPLAVLQDVARRLESAKNLSRRGRFGEADEQYASAAALRPDLEFISSRRRDCHHHQEQFRTLSQDLNRAVCALQWADVLNAADRLLEFAPECRDAVQARRRAWDEINARRRRGQPIDSQENSAGTFVDSNFDSGVDLRKHEGASHSITQTLVPNDEIPSENTDELFLSLLAPNDGWATAGAAGLAVGPAASSDAISADGDPGSSILPQQPPSERLMLWVDGVGGYLLCLREDIVLGQATPENAVDVPILGEISRRHARVRREGEEYFFEPFHPVRINGAAVQSPTLLTDGDELECGAVRFRFRKPHPLSATAKLELISRHRSQPRCDAILLMAESCVMGPAGHNHVVCVDWPDDVVLYRQGADLHCRAMEEIEIDGKLCEGRGPLEHDSTVKGLEFSFGLESIRPESV